MTALFSWSLKSMYGMFVLWQSTVMLHLGGREKRAWGSGRGGTLWCPDQQHSAKVLSKLLGTNYSVSSIVLLCVISAIPLALECRFAVLLSRWSSDMVLCDRSTPDFLELIQRRNHPAANLLSFTFFPSVLQLYQCHIQFHTNYEHLFLGKGWHIFLHNVIYSTLLGPYYPLSEWVYRRASLFYLCMHVLEKNFCYRQC